MSPVGVPASRNWPGLTLARSLEAALILMLKWRLRCGAIDVEVVMSLGEVAPACQAPAPPLSRARGWSSAPHGILSSCSRHQHPHTTTDLARDALHFARSDPPRSRITCAAGFQFALRFFFIGGPQPCPGKQPHPLSPCAPCSILFCRWRRSRPR